MAHDIAASTDDPESEDHWIRVFSSPSDAPRVRWRTDLISAGFIAATLMVLMIVAGNGSTFDDNTLRFAGGLPGWLLWLGQVTYVAGQLYTLALLVGVGVFARGRLELLRDMLLAALFASVVAAAMTQVLSARWPQLPFLELDRTATTFPAFFLTFSTAVQAAASPHLSAPMRRGAKPASPPASPQSASPPTPQWQQCSSGASSATTSLRSGDGSACAGSPATTTCDRVPDGLTTHGKSSTGFADVRERDVRPLRPLRPLA